MMSENEQDYCSICRDEVAIQNYADRGFSKLECGHVFHTFCIVKAVIAKNVMECPNCRHIGIGELGFQNGPQPSSDSSDDDSGSSEDNRDQMDIESSPSFDFSDDAEDAYDPVTFEMSLSSEFSDDDSVNPEDAIDLTPFEPAPPSELSDDDSVIPEDAIDLTPFEPSVFPFAGVSEFNDDLVNPEDSIDLTPFEPSVFPFAGVSEFSDDSVNPEDAIDLTPFEPSVFPFAGVSEFNDDSVNPEDAIDLTPFEPRVFRFAGVSDFSMLDASAAIGSSIGGLGHGGWLVNDTPDSVARQTYSTGCLVSPYNIFDDSYLCSDMAEHAWARVTSDANFTDNGWLHEIIISSLHSTSQERLDVSSSESLGSPGLLTDDPYYDGAAHAKLENYNPNSPALQISIMESVISWLVNDNPDNALHAALPGQGVESYVLQASKQGHVGSSSDQPPDECASQRDGYEESMS
ncbi:hypothetical protein M8C21_000444 [Ambrosia artemisiifolia]|uniref:RING-type domain-containing protein n=1 Tax=Ambrosia artemisiifolia TaxID=4212 RepID=A0AAD5DC97_AMBAR|nr:hypothetical protein M8C21_000444 [Ambrosia artemisiifolia]